MTESIEPNPYKDLMQRAYSIYEISEGPTSQTTYTQSVFGDIAEAIQAEGFPFSALHVEPLLDQAQELLSRALADRKIYSETSAQAFQISLELEEFSRLDEIHERERIAGAYTIESAKAKTELLAQDSLLEGARILSKDADETWGRNATFSEEPTLRTALAEVSAGPYDVSNGKRYQYDYTVVSKNFSGNKLDVIRDMSTLLEISDTQNKNDQLFSQKNQSFANLNAQIQRQISAQKNSDFLDATITTKDERLLVTRDLNAKKMTAVTTPDGPLNYAQLSVNARKRYVSNFVKAYQRLRAAASGLSVIYGFNPDFPDYSIYADAGLDVQDTFLDTCWLWTQEAVNHIALLQRQEQNTIISLGLRKLVGETEFKKASSSGQFDFSITHALLQGSKLARLRGFSVATLGGDANLATFASVIPPSELSYMAADGTLSKFDEAAAGDNLTVNYGRVREASGIRDPDVFGVVSFHNRSPLGKWRLVLEPRASLKDVIVELHLAVLVS